MGKNKKKNKIKSNISKIKVNETEKNNKPKKGIIGIPHTGLFHWQTVVALISLQYPENTLIKHHFMGSCLVYDARDSLINYAIQEDSDWIFFLDSDMVPPSDILVKLDKLNQPITSGLAFKRIPPFQPCFYTKVSFDKETKKPALESPIEFPDQGILECQGFGMACTMIKREVWEKSGDMINDKKTWFFPLPEIGEDLSFCLRARKAGFKLYVDLSVNCGHVSSMPIQKEHFFAARDIHRENNPTATLFEEKA
jgi:GT2 family glycosyltransferase